MKYKQGFSLVELLVVLAVVAFLAFVTAPLASGWIRNAQLEKDFAGVQRALGTAKALAMRNGTGMSAPENIAVNQAIEANNRAAIVCRKENNLFLASAVDLSENKRTCADADWNDIKNGAKPFYKMGQDVSIAFGNKKFCGAHFDSRGRVRLCDESCTTCTASFEPSTGLSVVVKGADTFKDPAATAAEKESNKLDPKDQTTIIRAF